jgi:hypothetical protein
MKSRSIAGRTLIWTAILTAGLAACGDLDDLKKEIRRTGHIEFQNPLGAAGPGTLLGGTPKRLQLVAPPQTCFPDAIGEGEEAQPTHLRFVDDSVLPSRSTVVSSTAEASAKLLTFLNGGNSPIGAGAKFSRVRGMELSFEGVRVEYLDSIRLTRFYRASMDELCKDYLEKVGFVIQAIKADKMAFKFYDKTGVALELSIEIVKDLLKLGTGVSYEISNTTQLIITTPKYLGYQLGKLQREDNGMALYRASRVKDGKFRFEPVSVFADPRSDGSAGGEPGIAAAAKALAPRHRVSAADFLPLEPGDEIRVVTGSGRRP